MLWACISFPHLALDGVLRQRADASAPLVLINGPLHARVLFDVNAAAARAGLHAEQTLTAARAIALKARPGQITDQELEKEGGGSGLRYSFDVKSGGRTYEVGVDAKSGKVLENGGESAAAEAAEAAAEHHGK